MAMRADFELGMACASSCVLRVNGDAVHLERRGAMGPASGLVDVGATPS